jgi:superfamily II DNA or RNA helicase
MLPKHHKTSFFLKSGLYDNLSDFEELENRISKLPITIDIGDAFEIFAEAYFFTQKIEQAEEVWPFKSVPSGIREDLSLGTNQQDMGVDGVYKTTSGQFNAYQAKFRTGRPSLTWREISTFMGLTDNVSQRVLFTNCNDMPSVINDRTGFHCIRGNDLDRLRKNDFETILKWLQSGDIEVERKTPLPHQDEAINDILTALKDEDRATALMACGTGKTLVALWVTEQIDCQNILVLLPSLTLVRQTLHEWLKETKWPHLSYLCVCSDPSVAGKELDSIKINQSDLDFAVTTNTATVKQFLSQDSGGVKIVFSTYQSSNIVAEAMANNYCFDLGIFDEAHKTTGRTDKKFGFALKDENLNIQKRLFLTATPRHYNLNKRNKEGDFDLAYSMDNPDVYGMIAHQLSFAVAARQNIICNYKVIISVVTSEQVNKEMLKRGEVMIDGDIVNAQQVAHQIAFKEAINKYDIKRVFTFHKSVKSAKVFTGKDSEGIHTHLPKFNTFHVNGTMPTAEREGVLKEFKDSDYSVISNARCLTEGVDLPAVDMVAFMSPKKSKIDIVQATGRAMRKDPRNPEKALGYILVPLYLEITTEESIEDAVIKADFEEVWNVLQALQEQDEVMTDIIRQIQEDIGKGNGEGGVIIDPIDIIAVDISLKTLQESITAVCIDKLGSSWDMRYGELIKYKEQFGHCKVPFRWSENKQLGTWVQLQRTMFNTGVIGDYRFKRLEEIGFEWSLVSQTSTILSWDEMFYVLHKYWREHGDCNVPTVWSKNKKLYSWVMKNRRSYKKGTLRKDQINRLVEIGFEWNIGLSDEEKWEEMFDALQEYREEYGDCNVPTVWSENQKLGNWARFQRRQYNRKKLSVECIKRLENIDFAWVPPFKVKSAQKWEEMLDALKEYKGKYGDCLVPHTYKENKQLYPWVMSQRNYYRKGKLSTDQIKRLEEIGFVW